MIENRLPKKVKLVEVGPRDGLQNEKDFVANDTKIELVNRLTQAGLPNIEAAAFVSPKWVPQMAGSDAVMAGIQRRSGTLYSVLVPNMQGYEKALAAGANEVVIFSSASEAFAQKNINCSIDESIARFEPVARAAKRDGIRLRGSIPCSLGCPYQGDVTPSQVVYVAQKMTDLGCDEIDIADTIGVGTAGRVKVLFETLQIALPTAQFSGHFHDTYGQALTNIYAALEVGISIFHSSIAGLGGCPYAKGATGNVATEDVVYLLTGLGIETGIKFEEIARIGAFITQAIDRPNHSRAGKAFMASQHS
jgi:hydroxymethylglutaryl-CoA lyase